MPPLQRLNVRKSRPNDNINFIKALPGSDSKTAEDFLERIAAQCLPIMRRNHLHVMTLEEFPANREFVGRNFNAGEVIQLVLKSPSSGRWLPFEYVQMVMMHELAHCKQMNHSKAFWAVRNAYAAGMRELWGSGYTGDGLWGRGKGLQSGLWEGNTVREGEVLPEHTCGGTFRSRGRKRGRKPVPSYQERKQRRIEKKFGKNGVALGADEDTKVKLEKGKKVKGTPRVAGSARGRDLRAAAALARFENQKVEEVKDETESGSDYDEDLPDLDSKDAVDINGHRMLDGQGRGLVKVCEDEEGDDPQAKDEMDELRDVFSRVKPDPDEEPRALADIPEASNRGSKRAKAEPENGFDEWVTGDHHVKAEQNSSRRAMESIPARSAESRGTILGDNDSTASESDPPGKSRTRPKDNSNPSSSQPLDDNDPTASEASEPELATKSKTKDGAQAPSDTATEVACSSCSFLNPSAAITCGICANVLKPSDVKGAWKCAGSVCKETQYWNAQDCGVCGLCGRKRG